MLFFIDNCHIDTEDEAVVFINTHIAHARAFLVNIGDNEVEQDCTTLYGSSKFHEFRYFFLLHIKWCTNLHYSSFIGSAGHVLVRLFPCCCTHCLQENFSLCPNSNYTQRFAARTMKPLGVRTQNARFNSVSTSQSTFIAKAIIGSRMLEGRYQYEIQWEDFEDTTWNDADQLDCIDLIEEYEANLS